MRISKMASFFVRRLLPQQKSSPLSPSLQETEGISSPEVDFQTVKSTLETLQQDYTTLKTRMKTLEEFQKMLITSPKSELSWPFLPPVKTKDPSVQALWDFVELRALILQEQARLRQKEKPQRKKTLQDRNQKKGRS
ncbi:MAG: hypothetical protein K2P90_02210 [Holosporales bacterium]|nr:hypothetical protein [Holosporales bacterium]